MIKKFSFLYKNQVNNFKIVIIYGDLKKKIYDKFALQFILFVKKKYIYIHT